jgi:hypothetical protein
VADDLDEIRSLKAAAKSARVDKDWQSAIDELDEAIALLRDLLMEASGQSSVTLSSELADAFGMIGGIERRWGLELDGTERRLHLELSVAAYDEGFEHEQHLDPKHASTYNRINRLVGRVLMSPRALDGEGDTTTDVPEQLRIAADVLVEQLGSAREKDPWVYCDLGMIRLLLGRSDALLTYHELERLRPPAFVFKSALETLRPLSEAASELRPDLPLAVAQLERAERYAPA